MTIGKGVPVFDGKMLKDYRNALMGVSIVFIIIYHFHPESPYLRFFKEYGWTGVDMFFYLSAIGLCYSLNSNPNVFQFYYRRICRIIPTWWLFLTCILAVSIIFGKSHPANFFDFFCYFTGVGWWINGLFDDALFVCYYEWYVPTQLLFYALFPVFFFISRKGLLFLTILCSIIIEMMLRFDICTSLHISYPRILSFLMGIVVFRYILTATTNIKKTGNGNYIIWGIAFISSILFSFNLISLNLFLSYIMPCVFYIIAIIIKVTNTTRIFAFIGSISLELYLVHIYWKVPAIEIGAVVIDGDLLLVPKFIICIGAALILKYTISFSKQVLTTVKGKL